MSNSTSTIKARDLSKLIDACRNAGLRKLTCGELVLDFYPSLLVDGQGAAAPVLTPDPLEDPAISKISGLHAVPAPPEARDEQADLEFQEQHEEDYFDNPVRFEENEEMMSRGGNIG